MVCQSHKKLNLQELAVLEEEHKRMEEEEKRNDVTKKRDLTDFYRDILSQRTADVASSVASTVAAPSSTQNTATVEAEEKIEAEKSVIKKVKSDKQRTYRSRRVTSTSDHAASQETDSDGDSDGESAQESTTQTMKTSDSNSANKSSPDKKEVKEAVKEDNPDRDDSDSSDSDSDKDEQGDKSGEEGVKEGVEEPSKPEVKKLLLSAEEKRAERIRLVKESCKKRNTPETIQAAIERYWKRQAAVSS